MDASYQRIRGNSSNLEPEGINDDEVKKTSERHGFLKGRKTTHKTPPKTSQRAPSNQSLPPTSPRPYGRTHYAQDHLQQIPELPGQSSSLNTPRSERGDIMDLSHQRIRGDSCNLELEDSNDDGVKKPSGLYGFLKGRKATPKTPPKTSQSAPNSPRLPPSPSPHGRTIHAQDHLPQIPELPGQNSPLNTPRSGQSTPRGRPHTPSTPTPYGRTLHAQNRLPQIPEQSSQNSSFNTPESSPNSPRGFHARRGRNRAEQHIQALLRSRASNLNDIQLLWRDLLKYRKQCRIELGDESMTWLTNGTFHLWSKNPQFTSIDRAIALSVFSEFGYSDENGETIAEFIEGIEDIQGIRILFNNSTSIDVVDYICAFVKFRHNNQDLIQFVLTYIMNELTANEESRRLTPKDIAKIALSIAGSSYENENIIAAFQTYILLKTDSEPDSLTGHDFVNLLCAFAKFGNYEESIIRVCIHGIYNSSENDELSGTEYANVLIALVKLQHIALANGQSIDSRLVERVIMQIISLLQREDFFTESDLVKITWGFARMDQSKNRTHVMCDLFETIGSCKRDEKYLDYIYDAFEVFRIAAPNAKLKFDPKFVSQYREFKNIKLQEQQDAARNFSPVLSPVNSPRDDESPEMEEFSLPPAMERLSIQDEGKIEDPDDRT